MQPIPKVVSYRDPNSGADGGRLPPPVNKNLFQVQATPKKLLVNGTPVKDLNEISQLFARYNKPIITLAIHRCVDANFSKTLLSTAQGLTDIPIAYNSYGEYDDPECQKK